MTWRRAYTRGVLRNSLWPRVQPRLAKVLVIGRIVRRGQRMRVSTPNPCRQGVENLARLAHPTVVMPHPPVAREPSRPDLPRSIWRAGAPPGSGPAAGDGGAARPG